MIRAEGLQKRFGTVVAVDGVSFFAPDGAVTGLLGPNGAGKTTCLRMVYGLMDPDGGPAQIRWRRKPGSAFFPIPAAFIPGSPPASTSSISAGSRA